MYIHIKNFKALTRVVKVSFKHKTRHTNIISLYITSVLTHYTPFADLLSPISVCQRAQQMLLICMLIIFM